MDNEIIEIGTLVTSASLSDLKSINNCFVDRTDMGTCLKFSRDPKSFTQKPYRHVGMYGFRSDVLFKLVELEPTIREKKEKLEQLRWLENGYTIHSSIINAPGLGVDTDEDLKIIKRIMEK
jgi:3-deoxy-manno-octulosonate cytidylyltransferase (CMP-KDO synthetase)